MQTLTLSELIVALQEILDEHGDMPIVSYDSNDEPWWGYGKIPEVMTSSTARPVYAHSNDEIGTYTALPAGSKYLSTY